MIHTFGTREEAAIFAAAMRSEGRFAEIFDEEMGSIYGPLAIGGIRVLVSDQASEEPEGGANGERIENPMAGSTPEGGVFLQALRLFTVSLVACGLIALVLFMLSGASQSPDFVTRFLVGVLKYPLILGLVFAVMGPWMGSFTRWLRGEREPTDTGCLRWLFLALITGFVVLMVL